MKLAQLTRSQEWWDHKTPQVLSFAYATALLTKVSLYELLFPAFFIILIGFILVAIYAGIINDLTDLEIDIACGKSNMMLRLKPVTRWLLTLSSLMLVLMVTYFIYPDIYAVSFYLCIAIAISSYSFPPVRLKNRGFWGVIACAAAEHLFPTLFSIAIVAHFSGWVLDFTWLTAAGIVAFCHGLRSILWHQFLDRENDLKSGIKTYVSTINPDSFKLKSLIIFAVEIMALITILFKLGFGFPLVFLLIYLIFIFIRQKVFKSEIIIIVSKKDTHFQMLMLDYYALFFPLSLLVYASYTQAYGWVVLIAHLLLFHKIALNVCMDAYHICKSIYKKIIN
ncbi:4-hydroxybenzoate polyprenyltransferase [Pedobacter sp. AK017]|uniref:UbiA family prenyltransferase n=1 Tax=Pedobacter sp. AK017 TaxID=2723073 RepID=UPI00160C29D5|nr:UbiA family prenyltransferase [Pedobacter sp. AK017]MBB5440351.1 4-hydroxybenzoate polyprenyltransferase [Pedobacter sp. AK017]